MEVLQGHPRLFLLISSPLDSRRNHFESITYVDWSVASEIRVPLAEIGWRRFAAGTILGTVSSGRVLVLFMICVPTQSRRIVASGFMLIPVLIFLIGLAAVLTLVPVFRRPFDRRTQKRRFGRLFGSAILLGYIFGGTLVWSFVPSEWPLSFGETLAASVDAKTYGHPIEHYAESILVVMLFACLAGALISVAVTAITAGIWIRNRPTPG